MYKTKIIVKMTNKNKWTLNNHKNLLIIIYQIHQAFLLTILIRVNKQFRIANNKIISN